FSRVLRFAIAFRKSCNIGLEALQLPGEMRRAHSKRLCNGSSGLLNTIAWIKRLREARHISEWFAAAMEFASRQDLRDRITWGWRELHREPCVWCRQGLSQVPRLFWISIR